jgi:hypothetical protein
MKSNFQLSEAHKKMLCEESAISETVIAARGYRTVTDKKELAALGFSKSQQLAPGLLLPVYAPDGSNGLYQFRPNAPRADKKSGKLIKYETPFGAGMRLDCPAACREQIKNPDIPLWITEGIKKGDSLASHSFCAVALLGVWNFKGENEFGGVTFLADFDYIALKGRKVRICFDSDIMHKPEVRKAMERLTEHLERKGAIVQAVYLPQDGTGKTGVDDYLAKHSPEELEKLVTEPKPAATPAPPVFELLDASPEEMRRPLQIIGDHAFAATWLHIRKKVSESQDENGNIIKHNPPKETVTYELIVLRDNGTIFGYGQKHSLDSLEFNVVLPEIPPKNRLLNAKAVTQFQNRKLPDALNVFERVKKNYDYFLDFNRSLADQETMCELSACYVLSTWFLDAFNVTGYTYATGGKGSGKSKHLFLTCELAYLGQFMQASGSVATLRDLADYGAFLGFDDAEQVSSKNYDPDKRNILLSGNRRGSQITMKDPVPNSREWRTRYVNTFCPRGFSAIRLPDDVLGDRSITFPLIRTANKQKADADVADESCWITNPNELRQDLWLLALANLTKVKPFDRLAANKASLHGRLLDMWRGSLVVALWLDEMDKAGSLKRANENGEIETLFERLNRLSLNYQKQRADLEKVDFTRTALRAAARCILGDSNEPFALSDFCAIGRHWKILTADIAARAKKIIEDEEIEVDFTAKDEKDFEDKLRKRIGREMKKLRFISGRQGGTGKAGWLVQISDLEVLLASFNLLKSEDAPTKSDSQPENFTDFTDFTSSQNQDCEVSEVCEQGEVNTVTTETNQNNFTNQMLFSDQQRPDGWAGDSQPYPCEKCGALIPIRKNICPNSECGFDNTVPF